MAWPMSADGSLPGRLDLHINILEIRVMKNALTFSAMVQGKHLLLAIDNMSAKFCIHKQAHVPSSHSERHYTYGSRPSSTTLLTAMHTESQDNETADTWGQSSFLHQWSFNRQFFRVWGGPSVSENASPMYCSRAREIHSLGNHRRHLMNIIDR